MRLSFYAAGGTSFFYFFLLSFFLLLLYSRSFHDASSTATYLIRALLLRCRRAHVHTHDHNQVTLAPHLAQTLSTSPRSIGFVLVLPNVLYTVTAMKAEDIVDRHGVRRTLLWGLCIMSARYVWAGFDSDLGFAFAAFAAFAALLLRCCFYLCCLLLALMLLLLVCAQHIIPPLGFLYPSWLHFCHRGNPRPPSPLFYRRPPPASQSSFLHPFRILLPPSFAPASPTPPSNEISLVMYGPSPALAPALVTRGAARGAIGVGLLAFQVGSALASVPAFTAMQVSGRWRETLEEKEDGEGGGGTREEEEEEEDRLKQ